MECIRLADENAGEALAEAARTLRAGGIVLYPTDTVYGLAADVTNADAIARLYELKGREQGKPVLILVEDIASMGKYAVMNETANRLAVRFLPGALTLVLPAKDTLPKGFAADDGTVGIRVPNDPFCLALAREFGGPFTSTSANVAGEETRVSVDGILAQFGERAKGITLAIDAGKRGSGKPSTVVSCVSDVPVVLREGALSASELAL
ncbi:MAG: threonylcarbamoyl-AMP synthase [Patescibacteria group bacterium]|nr:threonylcarbamoyl-AMP synthase [Patescibacteria group bacterium]